MNSLVAIIPAYEPKDILVDLVSQLVLVGFIKVVVVDDGSTSDKKKIFELVRSLGAEVLVHEKNLGKGGGIKNSPCPCF